MAFHVIRYQGNTIDVVFSSVCHILPVAAMVQLHIKQLAFIISIVYRKASSHRYERKQDSGHENEGVQNLIGFRFKISIRFIWQYTCIKHCEIHRVSPVLAKQVVFRLSFPTESIRRTASVIISITCIIILTTKQILAVLCFYSKTDFWHSYCQILTDLDKILHTPIVVRSILVGRLRPRSARGRLQTRTTVFFFCNTGGDDGCCREFCSVGRARSKTAFFSLSMVHFDYPARSLQETVLPQTSGTAGKRRLWRCGFC